MAQQKGRGQQETGGEKRSSGRDWTKRYDESDLAHVLDVSHARNWNDAIKYLDRNGMNDNELTPGETISMKADLQKAAKAGGKFVADPKAAYREIKGGGARQASQKKR